MIYICLILQLAALGYIIYVLVTSTITVTPLPTIDKSDFPAEPNEVCRIIEFRLMNGDRETYHTHPECPQANTGKAPGELTMVAGMASRVETTHSV